MLCTGILTDALSSEVMSGSEPGLSISWVGGPLALVVSPSVGEKILCLNLFRQVVSHEVGCQEVKRHD